MRLPTSLRSLRRAPAGAPEYAEDVPEYVTPPSAVALETDVGALLFPSCDRVMVPWIRHHGCWEPLESGKLRALLRPGMTFLDVGAHVGYAARLAAGIVGPEGRVIAVEPEAANFSLLALNMADAQVWTRLIHAAASRAPGTITLSIDEENTGDHRAYARAGLATVDTPAVVLDDVIPASLNVDVVKVDTQGTDHLAIEGLSRTIGRCRPVLLVEFWPPGIREYGDDPQAVLSYYRTLDLRLSVLEAPELGHDPPPEAVTAAASATDSRFCTLLLEPRAMRQR